MFAAVDEDDVVWGRVVRKEKVRTDPVASTRNEFEEVHGRDCSLDFGMVAETEAGVAFCSPLEQRNNDVAL